MVAPIFTQQCECHDFVKQMYAWGCPIEGYVESGAITPDETVPIVSESDANIASDSTSNSTSALSQ